MVPIKNTVPNQLKIPLALGQKNQVPLKIMSIVKLAKVPLHSVLEDTHLAKAIVKVVTEQDEAVRDIVTVLLGLEAVDLENKNEAIKQ
jgi:hypothetical protein